MSNRFHIERFNPFHNSLLHLFSLTKDHKFDLIFISALTFGV